MQRFILHSDANAFYASVECLFHPELQGKPVAIAGDPAARHGIILAKNQAAKAYGVATAQTIQSARDKCPQLILLPPNYPLYEMFAEKLRTLYAEYSNQVEPYGLDEAWLDVSRIARGIGEATDIAQEIRERAKREIGITVSIGVSFNKVFAKLGSDLRKPDAVSTISKENYRQLIWPLPASNLLFVGRQTAQKLFGYGIETIGDLAKADPELLATRIGKNGGMLQDYARGLDNAPVLTYLQSPPLKSIGNSTTPPHDIRNLDDARCILFLLAESVAGRLRQSRLRASCLAVQVRAPDLSFQICQCTFKHPTALTSEIARQALALFEARFAAQVPYRGIGIQCGALRSDEAPEQLDLFQDAERRERAERLERAVDTLRSRYGQQAVRRGVVLADRAYAGVHPSEHIQPAAPFFR